MLREPLLLVLTAAVPVAAQDVAVRPMKIEETRVSQLVESKTPASSRLSVTLELSGQGLDDINEWGEIRLTKVVDDKGTDLKPERNIMFGSADTPPSKGFSSIDRKQMWFFEDEPPKNKLKMNVLLGLPTRAATHIEHLEGTVTLVEAQIAKLRVAQVAKLVDKGVEDERLKAAGVTVKVKKVNASAIELSLAGAVDSIREIRIVDAAGEDVGSGSSSFGSDRSKQMTLYGQVGADAAIEIELMTDKKQRVMPFKLERIPLP